MVAGDDDHDHDDVNADAHADDDGGGDADHEEDEDADDNEVDDACDGIGQRRRRGRTSKRIDTQTDP